MKDNTVQLPPSLNPKLLQREDNTEQEQYFFIIKTNSGEELLRSRPYSKPEEREEGIQIAVRHLQDDANYAVKEASGDYYFVLKDAEGDSIARSALYESKTKVQRAMNAAQQLLESAEEEQQPAKTTTKKSSTKKKATSKKKATTKKKTPSSTSSKLMDDDRHVFRLTFYRSEDNNTLQGQIEYPRKKTKQTFNGIDEMVIRQFLLDQLDDEAQMPLPTPQDAGQAELILRTGSTIVQGNQLDRSGHYQVEMTTNALKAKSGTYKVSVMAKSLHSKQKQLVGEQQQEFSANTNVSVPIITTALDAGLFRLAATLTIVDQKGKAVAFTGDKLVHVY